MGVQEPLALHIMGTTKSFRFIAAILFAGLLIFSGCASRHRPLAPDADEAESDLPPAATHELVTVLTHYLSVKDALVADDAAASRKAALAMSAALRALIKDSMLADGKVPNQARGTADTLLAALQQWDTEEDCERQRIYFGQVSDAVYQLLLHTGLRHITIYRHLCPMAFNETGAYWLSLSPDVRNPYFGKKMLSCGELLDSIP